MKKEKEVYNANLYSFGEIKLLPKEKIFIQSVRVDGEMEATISKTTHERYPDPQLTKYMIGKEDSQLKDYVIKVMGYCKFFDLAENEKLGKPERDAFSKLKVARKQYYKMIFDSISITAIKLNGVGDTTGVVLTYRYNPHGASKHVEQKTPSITLNSEMYGFEEDLKTIIQNMNEECFEYEVNKKSGLVEMEVQND